MKEINFPPFVIDLMMSLSESIKQGHAIEITYSKVFSFY